MAELFTRKTLFDKIRSTNSEEDWTEYVSYYKGYIYALLRGMNVSSHDCDDLLQIILVKCWKHLPQFEYNPERCKFRSWLTTLVRNSVRDHLKSRAHKSKQLEVGIEQFGDSLQDQGVNSIEKTAEKEWRIYVAELAWKTVRREFKQTVIEAFIRRANGEKISTVAESMNIAPSSVSTYEKRVKRAMAKEIIRLESFLG